MPAGAGLLPQDIPRTRWIEELSLRHRRSGQAIGIALSVAMLFTAAPHSQSADPTGSDHSSVCF